MKLTPGIHVLPREFERSPMRLQSFVSMVLESSALRGRVGRSEWWGDWLKGKLGSVADDVSS